MDGWRKSSYSDGNGGQCVEVASAAGVMVRATTARGSVTLIVSSEAWKRFTDAIK